MTDNKKHKLCCFFVLSHTKMGFQMIFTALALRSFHIKQKRNLLFSESRAYVYDNISMVVRMCEAHSVWRYVVCIIWVIQLHQRVIIDVMPRVAIVTTCGGHDLFSNARRFPSSRSSRRCARKRDRVSKRKKVVRRIWNRERESICVCVGRDSHQHH